VLELNMLHFRILEQVRVFAVRNVSSRFCNSE
jgi:hypothetical protein